MGFSFMWALSLGVDESKFATVSIPPSWQRMPASEVAPEPEPLASEPSEEELSARDEAFTSEMVREAEILDAHEPERGEVKNEPIRAETAQALRELRAKIRTFAPRCSDGSLTLHECPFGDSLEYMGNLCLSGETEWCDFVRRSQGQNGQFWRSPGQVDVGHTIGTDRASFSRDMARGVWAYLIHSKDTEAAKKWLEFIRSTPGHHLCKKSARGWDACATRAGFWAFATEMWDYLELPRYKKKMTDFKFLVSRVYDPIEIRFQPKGYPALLTASTLYQYQELEKRGHSVRNRKTHRKIARYIHKREPENPFYKYLVYGPTQSGAETLLKYCPKELPREVPKDEWGPIYSVDFEGPWTEWVNEKSKRASGHYCVFYINLYLGSAN